MNRIAVFATLILAACSSQPPAPIQEQDISDIQVFLEEPAVAYESLGRVDETGRGQHPADILEKSLMRAAELGADGVIVHAVRNQGRIASGNDLFGTGGSDRHRVYQIQATAIRYVE